MKAPALLFLTLTALATQAQASSPDAWAAFDKAVLASCTKASQLSHTKPVGNAAQFDDRVGYTALLLQGKYPQGFGLEEKPKRVLVLNQYQNKSLGLMLIQQP